VRKRPEGDSLASYLCVTGRKMVNFKGARKSLLKQLKFARAFAKSFKEFLSKTFIHAYHYLVEPNRHITEKLMWGCLHLTMTISAIYIVLFAWSRFTENPTITTLESQHHSIFDLEFPAVAICSNNKISKWRAEEYADFL
jgi:Amiloride-sensitive sodium channel